MVQRDRPSPADPGSGSLEDLRLDRQLCFALYSSTNKVVRLYNVYLQPMGITFSQYLTLLALWEKSPRIVSELARALEIEPNTVTPLIKRMEALGLVSRLRDADDERQVHISVTEKGLKLRDRALAMRANLIDNIDLTMAEIGGLRDGLHQLAKAVDIGKG